MKLRSGNMKLRFSVEIYDRRGTAAAITSDASGN